MSDVPGNIDYSHQYYHHRCSFFWTSITFGLPQITGIASGPQIFIFYFDGHVSG